MPIVRTCLLVVLLAGIAGQLAAAPPLVVETDPLTPADQQTQFVLPDGFQIELIASEPDIGQPMNLSFDAAGRLWVTHSVEYPYPVAGPGVEARDDRFGPNGDPPAKDRLSIVSGIGTDDVQITHVAEGLNIPIGITPLSTTSALLYAIPNLSRVTIADHSQPSTLNTQPLFGPFGNFDTHGMVNGLTYWIDGWVYACHGFRNTSTIKGTDGHQVSMNSGNTFRFKPDGSHVEQWTWGQVNPFGMTFDPWGNIYTADCHSKPLTCLIPGAYYSSFGKPHDGLGFGPDMINHSHGSTGICGPCYYAAEHFPSDYRNNLFLCNPVTGIVHRDKLVWHGSTPQVDSQPDFITCRDGWFRPVDIQLGPDGALYIADFYNSIIGHYEVPLEDPRRDRTHGRIWRVTYEASRGRESPDERDPPAMPDLTQESFDELILRLSDPNLTTRVLAAHRIFDRAEELEHSQITQLKQVLATGEDDSGRVQALWLLDRLDKWPLGDGVDIANGSALVKTHLARLIGNRPSWQQGEERLAAALLRDENPFVRRAAAEAFARHPQKSIIETLLDTIPSPSSPDTHLRHAMRIALRNCLRGEGTLQSRIEQDTTSDEIASVCLGINSAESAAYLLNHLRLRPKSASRTDWITHVARYGKQEEIGSLTKLLREQSGRDLSKQVAALEAINTGQSFGNAQPHPEFLAWATDVASALLDQVRTQSETWRNLPLPQSNLPPVEWGLETRRATDRRSTQLWSSLPGGERGVGIARSPSFAMPEQLTFWLAGHDGFPQEDAAGLNFARLVRDEDGAILRFRPAPRQDPPVKVVWDAGDDLGVPVHIELVDGLNIGAYAWIAAGRFSFERLNPQPDVPSKQVADLITSLRLSGLEPQLRELIADPQLSSMAVADLAGAVENLVGDYRLEALHLWLVSDAESMIGRRVRELFTRGDDEAISQLLIDAMKLAPGDRQQEMADVLASNADGAYQLIGLIEAGHASPRLLQSASVTQKLLALRDYDLLNRSVEITRELPPKSHGASELIEQRRASFTGAAPSIERGRAVFKQSCAACHQIAGEGNKIGPQLDGVGIRGLDRLLEDTLDPNRNVDAAFRTTTILTTDGRVLSGLIRREEGDALILADTKGEEFRVPVAEIDERALSPLSLMPEDVATKLTERELHDLLAYLLAQKQQPVSK